jgi:DNA mismatch repair protein MutS
MMKQYRAAKEEVPEALLFFRMGDFFELFGLDAIVASDICGLTLTSRDRASDNPIPMAGIPVVAHRAALKKCIVAGFKVAVCDQVEDPRLAKSIVRREITRIATPAVPGDLGEGDEGGVGAAQSDAAEGCYLACVVHVRADAFSLAFVDVSTAEFRLTGNLSRESLEEELLTLRPREILCTPDLVSSLSTFARSRFSNVPRVGIIEPWILRSEPDARALFCEFFAAPDLNRFGVASLSGGLVGVCGLLAYLKHTQKGVLKNLRTILTYEKANHLLLDEATKRHLDFFSTASGERKGSLFNFLNRCATAAGARALARRLHYPFKAESDVREHLECVADVRDRPQLEEALGRLLSSTADIDRLVARVAQGSIDPRGLAWLRQTLETVPLLRAALSEHAAGRLEARVSAFAPSLDVLVSLHASLASALDDEPAAVLGKGGRVFRAGFSPELDEVIGLETNFEGLIADLEKREREKTGITNLKVGYTRVFGYYFEISKGRLSQVPPHFLRKQTLTNGERFITEELKELEEKALVATEKRGVLERELFENLKARVLEFADVLGDASRFLAEVDVVRTFSLLAGHLGWCRPQVSSARESVLKASVHPILANFSQGHEPFVANDIAVGEGHGHVLLITGPNMAGKSTVMRQLAIAQVLFQMGSYVPAQEARLGVCDRLFTRIGSGDFLLRAQSTFMVEMLETAHILRNATPASLILVDELGRGTSTFDGLSLAWSILEDLHDRVRARALFSTHYHEILAVKEGREGIVPMQMEVVEQASSIVFSRRFKPGAAGKSYGLHVAEMAGLPDVLLKRAAVVLHHLNGASTRESDLPPVAQTPALHPRESLPSEAEDVRGALVTALCSLEVDALTPRDALDALYELRDVAKAFGPGVSLHESVAACRRLADAFGASARGKKRGARAGATRGNDETLF